MYNFAGIFLGGILALIFVGLYLLLTSRFVVEPLLVEEDYTKAQKSFSQNKLLWSGVIAWGIVFVAVLIPTLFDLSLATRLFLVTFMASAVISIAVILYWIFCNKKRLYKLQAKWYHRPLGASCIITLVFVIVFTIATL